MNLHELLLERESLCHFIENIATPFQKPGCKIKKAVLDRLIEGECSNLYLHKEKGLAYLNTFHFLSDKRLQDLLILFRLIFGSTLI